MNQTIQENKIHSFTDKLKETSLSFNTDLKEEAMRVLASSDFPTTKTEAWKYTRVGKIAALKAQDNDLKLKVLPESFIVDKNAYTVVFENGQFNQELSSVKSPSGIIIKPISTCSADELEILGERVKLDNEVFNSLNTVYTDNGIYIRIEDNKQIETCVQIIHILSGEQTVSNTRNLIVAGKFSKASIIQASFALDSVSSFNNCITEIRVHENAHLILDKIQYESAGNFQICTEQVSQEKDSTFTINTLTLNGSFVRNNLNIEVDGVNCLTNLNGIYLLKENQHVDNHTVVDHKAPHCLSNELYKGVIDDKATGVFNGKVFVRKDSQKINAYQSNANVLLGDNATVNSKPELEILADDVKCSHGSTTGQLDDEAIFYLRARGISEKSAKHLMVGAFIEDVLSKIENSNVLEFTNEILKDRFEWEF